MRCIVEMSNVHCVLAYELHDFQVVLIIRRGFQGRGEIYRGAVIVFVSPSSCHPKKGATHSMGFGSQLCNPPKDLDCRSKLACVLETLSKTPTKENY